MINTYDFKDTSINLVDNWINLYNEKAIDFYKGKINFKSFSFRTDFKSTILSIITDIERTIRGTFASTLRFENVDVSLFMKMFPHICEMFNISDKQSLEVLGDFLTRLRNSNAHAYLSEDNVSLFKSFKIDLSKEWKISNRIQYYRDGFLTLGGMIYILFNMLRETSIKKLTKMAHHLSILLDEKYHNNDGIDFVANVSKVNLDVLINNGGYKTVRESIFNNYINLCSLPNDSFFLEIGDKESPLFKVDGSYRDNVLLIKQGSLSNVFYKNDFTLLIKDEPLFIDVQNKLAPMGLVDILYFNNINTFDESVMPLLNTDKRDIFKLNQPKFYVDKNINILFAPEEQGDYRRMSSVISSAMTGVILNLEDYLYRTKDLNAELYSGFGDALSALGLEPKLKRNLISIRNSSFHGYLLNEYNYNSSSIYQFTYDSIITTLESLLNWSKNNDFRLHETLQKMVDNGLVNKFIFSKYSGVSDSTFNFIKEYPNIPSKDVAYRNNLIKNTSYDTNELQRITTLNKKLFIIHLSNLNTELCLLNIRRTFDSLMRFINIYADKHEYKNKDKLITDLYITMK